MTEEARRQMRADEVENHDAYVAMGEVSHDPIFDVDAVLEAKEVLESGETDWEYLGGEERHGTVVQALQLLEQVV